MTGAENGVCVDVINDESELDFLSIYGKAENEVIVRAESDLF